MQTGLTARRDRANLAIAMAITALVGLISVCVNALDQLYAFFAVHANAAFVHVLLNGLFFWLLVLLVVAFWRWRQSERAGANLKRVIEGINPDTLLVVDPDRTIRLTNPTVKPMFGYAETEVLDHRTDMLYEDRRADPARPREIYEALQRKGYHLGAAIGRRRDGQPFPMEIITGELPGEEGAVLLLRDISDRVQAEARRHQTEEQMRHWQYLESFGVLAGGVAHDFNNILTGVVGNADLALTAEGLPAEVRENLREILLSAQRAAAICRDLLTYAGRLRPRLEPLTLSATLREYMDHVRELVPANMDLRWELAETLPTIMGDAGQMRALLQNLVCNAVEAINGRSDGRIVVRTAVRECDAADLACGRGAAHATPGRYVALEVEDNGDGIDPSQHERIFDPFFSTRFPGRGLGLAAAIGIARGHHAVLKVRSATGAGATFTVWFPAPRAAGETP